jgi:hypothetical protein
MATRRCGGDGLILAGGIVTLVGLGVVLVRALAMPREWVPVVVGLALLGAGLIRRARRTDGGS